MRLTMWFLSTSGIKKEKECKYLNIILPPKFVNTIRNPFGKLSTPQKYKH